jgi:hypothetical protein
VKVTIVRLSVVIRRSWLAKYEGASTTAKRTSWSDRRRDHALRYDLTRPHSGVVPLCYDVGQAVVDNLGLDVGVVAAHASAPARECTVQHSRSP